MLVLFTDSDTDITPVVARELGYNLISMPYMIGEEVFYPYKDSDTFDFKAFYDQLRNKVMPKTNAISPMDYYNYFKPHFENGDDILYVHFSKAMSGTFNAMNIALDMLKEEYPDRKFYTIDTKGISIISYSIAKSVAELYHQGKSIDEILAWADKEVDNHAIYFYADDLQFFRRSGRVGGLAAFFGGLIGIHPIIHMNEEGKMVSVSKARGKLNTLKKIVSFIEEKQDDIKNHKVIIGHSDAMDTALLMEKLLKEKFGDDLNIEFVYVNPTAGSHCGPNNIGVTFHSKGR